MSDSVLVYSERDPLFGMSAEELESQLRQALRGRVEQAYFFGSFGTKSFHQNSDIDLVLVTETDAPFPARNVAFADLLDIHPAMDILVYTPVEYQRLTSEPDSPFWQSLQREARRFL